MTKYIWLIFSLFCLESCSSTKSVTKIDIQKMPVSYEFNISKDSLQNVIVNTFSKCKIRAFDTLNRITAFNKDLSQYFCIWADEYIRNKRYYFGINLYLPAFYDEYIDKDMIIGNAIGLSYNYVFQDTDIHPVYQAFFRVELYSLTPQRTKAIVVTSHPFIVNGWKVIFDAHRGIVTDPSRIPAEPSTIEEYQILSRIGDALGVKSSMPPLVLPPVK